MRRQDRSEDELRLGTVSGHGSRIAERSFQRKRLGPSPMDLPFEPHVAGRARRPRLGTAHDGGVHAVGLGPAARGGAAPLSSAARSRRARARSESADRWMGGYLRGRTGPGTGAVGGDAARERPLRLLAPASGRRAGHSFFDSMASIASMRSHEERLKPRRWAASSKRFLSSAVTRSLMSATFPTLFGIAFRVMRRSYHRQASCRNNRVVM